MNRNTAYILLFTVLFLVGCKQQNKPDEQNKIDTRFHQLFSTNHGQFYSDFGIKQQVIELDFLSEGLIMDSVGHISGSGTNLYFSDIFIPQDSSTLPIGTYHADTTAAPMTFLGSKNFDGNITGAYLLYIQDSQLQSITLFPNGSFTVTDNSDSLTIDFHLQRTDSSYYDAHFSSPNTSL